MGESLCPEEWSTNSSDRLVAEPSTGSGILAEVVQLELNWMAAPEVKAELLPPPLQTEPEPEDRGNELDQSERIQILEQALDQCQLYIHELKAQLVEQQFLETVLAQTEEAAQIQQQAIATLKQQLTQQAVLEAQLIELEQEKVTLQKTLAGAEALAQSHLIELQSLQQQSFSQQEQMIQLQDQLTQRDENMLQLQTQLQEAESRATDQSDLVIQLQSQLSDLEATLREHEQAGDDLEMRLQRTKEVITAQQGIISALQQAQGSDSEKNKVIQGMSRSLLQSQNKLAILEGETAQQRLLQAQLQHYSQELESQTLSQQKRMTQLEQQVAEMQEQILQQAQQCREYETAVQHWKDRYLTAEQSITQLKTVLQQLLTDRQLSELLLTPQSAPISEGTLATISSESIRLLKGLKLDLPAFLAGRRLTK